MRHLKLVLTWAFICTVLLLASLFFKSLGDPKRQGLIITLALLGAALAVIGMVCRQGK